MEETQTKETTQEKVIPAISIQEDKLVVETFDVPLVVNDKTVMIKMKKLTAGEHQDLVKKSSNIKVVGKSPTGTVDGVGYQIGLLTRVIVDAPFPVTIEFLSSLPETMISYLFEEYTTFISTKKKD